MLKFKQIFPKWQDFKQFVIDYTFYYDAAIYTDEKIMVYYYILYRNFANSHLAFDNQVFLEMLSLTVSENFREFFIIRGLMDLVAAEPIKELVVGIETINNMAENPNIDTDKDTVVNYIGSQMRNTSRENIVDRVYSLIPRIAIPEILMEVAKYDYLFLKIIPRTNYYFIEEEDDE